MFDGIFTPEFLQAACSHATPEPEDIIRLHVGTQSVFGLDIRMSFSGQVTITYILDGNIQTHVIDESPYETDDCPDEDTYITIKGNVTLLSLAPPPNTAIDIIDTTETKSLLSLTTNENIEELRISKYLTYLKVNGTNIKSVSYPANNNAVSTAIANAITGADANDGIVYTDPDGTYYDTIAQAATAKGWNIITSNEQ